MLSAIWTKIKSVAAFVYNWITVIVGIVVAAPTAVIDFLNAIQAIDWGPLISSQTALAITAFTATAKAVVQAMAAAYSAAKAKQAG